MTFIDPNNSVSIVTDNDVTVIQTTEAIGPVGPQGPQGPPGADGQDGAGSPSTAPPPMDGTAAIGTSLNFARQDHVHPSNTSRVAKAGDTMTGALVLAGDPTVNLGAATKQYVDGNSVHHLLNVLTASNSAALADLTSLTAAFDEYELHLINLIPAVAQKMVQLQLHSGGAFKTTGYLGNCGVFGAATNYSFTTTAFVPLSYPSTNNTVNPTAAAPGLSGVIRIVKPASGAVPIVYGTVGWLAASGALMTGLVGGIWNSPGAVIDGFQINMDSGNITSGAVKVYGVR